MVKNIKWLVWIIVVLVFLLLSYFAVQMYRYGNYLQYLPFINSCGNQIYRSHYKKPPVLTWQGQSLITFWFDDAWRSQFTEAFPMLKKAGFVAALAVTPDLVCQRDAMSWNEIRYLQGQGWEITAHSKTHTCVPDYYTDLTISSEFGESKKIIEKQGLGNIQQFVMPCGYNYLNLRAAAKNYGYTSFRSTYGGMNKLPLEDVYNLHGMMLGKNTDLNAVKSWIAQAKVNKIWLIIIIHRVDNSPGNFNVTPEFFAKLVALVKESGLPVVLPTQVIQSSANLNTPAGQSVYQ